MTKRQYKDAFLNLGFTCIIDHGVERPQCVICAQVLSNESLKENKLRRHLHGKHVTYVDKARSFFERKESELKRQKLDSIDNKVLLSMRKATLASYLVARHIARQKILTTLQEN